MKVKELLKPKNIHEQCQHYWVIEPAITKTSLGTCKYCGITKEFMNTLTQYNDLDRFFGKQKSDDNELIGKNYGDKCVPKKDSKSES